MTIIPFILGLVLVAIAALSAVRNWWLRRDESFDSAEWLGQTTAGLNFPAPATSSDHARDFQRTERDFYRIQFRRRMQISAMLGLTGVLLPWTTLFDEGLGKILYAAVLLALVGWMLMLALADLVATRHHFTRVREHLLAETLARAKTESGAE